MATSKITNVRFIGTCSCRGMDKDCEENDELWEEIPDCPQFCKCHPTPEQIRKAAEKLTEDSFKLEKRAPMCGLPHATNCNTNPCDSCVSYGESQEGKAIHFVSKEAEDEFHTYLLNEQTEASPTDPDHYHTAIEPIEYILANGLDFCEGNVIKYVTRWRNKNGVEDLKKAKVYLDFLINKYEEGL